MADTIGSIEVRLRADIARLESDLKKAEGRTRVASNRMRSSFKRIGTAVKQVRGNVAALAGIIAAVGAGGFAQLTKKALDTADAIGKTSSKLGISASALQELQFAAAQSGVAVTTLNMGLQRFGRRAAEAAVGTGEAKDALAQLKIELHDGQGELRATEELFGDTMKALSEIESPLERVRLVFKLFDSEGVALVNMAGRTQELREEAQRLGIVLDDEVIENASKTKDELHALWSVAEAQLTPALIDLGGSVLVSLAETMSEVAGWANKVYRAFADIKNLGMSNAQIALREELENEADILERIEAAKKTSNRKTVVSLNSALKESRQRIKDLEDQVDDLEEKREEARKTASGEREHQDQDFQTGQQRLEAERDLQTAIRERQSIEKEAHDELLELQGEKKKRIEEDLAANLAALDQATEAEGDYQQARTDLKNAADLKIREIDQNTAEELSDLRLDIQQRYLQATGQEIKLIENARDAEIEALGERGLAHKEYLEDRKKLEEIYQERIAELRAKAAEDEKSTIEESKNHFGDLFESIESGFEDTLATMVMGGEISFKQLAESFLREFVQKGISQFTDLLTKESTWDLVSQGLGWASSLFGTVGGMFGFGGGSYGVTGGRIGPPERRANGGPISALANGGTSRGPVLVGERGPELFIPGKSGFVASNFALQRMASRGGSGGSRVNVTVINNTGQESTTSERDGADGTREIEILVGKAVTKNIQRGGDVDQAIRSSYGIERVGRHGV